MQESHRQVIITNAVQDPNSSVYRNLVNLLKESDAAERRAKERMGTVLVPFHLDEADTAALEQQFGVTVSLRPSIKRFTATSRVAGMVHLIDDALYEHSSGPGRNTLFIDGDLMTVAARGLNGKIVERTHALARLSSGYFREEEQLRSFSASRNGPTNKSAEIMYRQVLDGGGENYHPSVRQNGPRVANIIINHFRTPAYPHQLAWLANCRGSVVYGAIFFQPEMLIRDSGDLLCFPGRFYIDRKEDVITLVPESDASMSFSHPYSAWYKIVSSNSITSGGKEYLCEKYKSITGFLYYTLAPVGSKFEVCEQLRTNFFDRSLLDVTRVSFPRPKLSDSGVLVGYERGSVLINTPRFESVLSRLLNSANEIVKPAEAFSVLMDHNNTSVVSLDHTKTPERMDVADENDLALALSLHVNWQRHIMRGTFRAMVSAVKDKHSLGHDSLYRCFMVVMSAWLRRCSITDTDEDDIPQTSVVDWYGNDFSVLMENADPWVEFTSVAGECKETSGVNYRWFPTPPREPGWFDALYDTAYKAVGYKRGDAEKEKKKKNEFIFFC